MSDEKMETKPWSETGRLVGAQVAKLQAGYTRSPRDEWSQRTLAQLRRADAAAPGADAALWQVTFDGLPESVRGVGDAPSIGEAAAHATLVMYAIHQQSKGEPMHRQGVGLGQAVRDLARARSADATPDPGVLSRFHALVRAQTRSARLSCLRALVGLMRAESIPLDYGRLASDLWLLETKKSDVVRLRWGRQLHLHKPTTEPTEATAVPEGENP
ncbi:type I-E CRISPR-associated protein Cse2/CasB [Tessaracoccus flavescens]|nr:type I-E CRISPR-associated protein Cse2/CasB [Tessaracoccus flavescens]